jgi:hypothetical protein
MSKMSPTDERAAQEKNSNTSSFTNGGGGAATPPVRGEGTEGIPGSFGRDGANIHHRQNGRENIRTSADSASVDPLVGLCHIRPIPQRLMD